MTDIKNIIDAVQEIAGVGGRTAFGGPPAHSIISTQNIYTWGAGDTDLVIFSPAPDSVVAPEQLDFQWTPAFQNAKGARLWISDDQGTELWREGVPGEGLMRAGCSDYHSISPTARQALTKQENSVLFLNVEILFEGGREKRCTVRFRILSNEQKKALHADLSVWDNEPSEVLKHVFRAHVFAKYKMFNEVANEYDEALKIEPHSDSIFNAAISAHHRTGNFCRERELTGD
jgi:hypothetical protein